MTAQPVPLRTPAEDALLKLFPEIRDVLPGGSAVEALRDAAFEDISARGLPHRRVEEWKYTDLRANLRHAAPLARPADPAHVAAVPRLLGDASVRRLVVANGSFLPALSDLEPEDGLSITSLEEALAAGDTGVVAALGRLGAAAQPNQAVALNTAFMRDGVIVRVAPGAVIERPIEIVALTEGDTPQATYLRSVIEVGAEADVTIYETFADAGGAANQTNAMVQLVVGDNAKVRYRRILAEHEGGFHLGTLDITLGERTVLDLFSGILGGGLVRIQPFVTFRGAHAEATLRGVTLVGERRHGDTTLVVEHDAPGCVSRELFKAVVDDEARVVFQGKIVVPSHAQKTDGKMMLQALLLSETAEADAKPELEIFADDVVCGHGATVGAVDEDLLFYLRARGIPRAEAEAMLILAFLGEATDAAGDDLMSEVVIGRAEAWLKGRGRRS